MKKIVALTALFLLFSSLTPALAGKKKHRTRAKAQPRQEQRVDEIDNYDFLYLDEGVDYGYNNNSMVNNILDEAFAHMGARYSHGSAGPYVFDCSGFTSYVFGKMGISLSRSSRQQSTQGYRISNSDLQSGDLVFFTSPRSGGNVGHVGIVVDVDPATGSFNFIHASLRGVKVSNSRESYYARRYLFAKRVM
jgi:hypothetical protein